MFVPPSDQKVANGESAPAYERNKCTLAQPRSAIVKDHPVTTNRNRHRPEQAISKENRRIDVIKGRHPPSPSFFEQYRISSGCRFAVEFDLFGVFPVREARDRFAKPAVGRSPGPYEHYGSSVGVTPAKRQSFESLGFRGH